MQTGHHWGGTQGEVSGKLQSRQGGVNRALGDGTRTGLCIVWVSGDYVMGYQHVGDGLVGVPCHFASCSARLFLHGLYNSGWPHGTWKACCLSSLARSWGFRAPVVALEKQEFCLFHLHFPAEFEILGQAIQYLFVE